MTEHTASRYRLMGLGLMVIACIGFFTVADESRHIGELFGVIGILVSGIAIAAAGFFPKLSPFIALQWVAAGIGIGMVVGAVTDSMVAGVCGGVSLGLIASYLMRKRKA
jgi:hypothetical protein